MAWAIRVRGETHIRTRSSQRWWWEVVAARHTGLSQTAATLEVPVESVRRAKRSRHGLQNIYPTPAGTRTRVIIRSMATAMC